MYRVTDIWRVAMPTLLMGLGCPALQAAPTINTPVVTPATVTVNQSTLVTASSQINTSAGDPPLLAGGVDLVRAPNAHMAATVVGIMHDDGQNGDVTAGDGIFTLQFTDSEPAAGQFLLQCTAAFKGMLLRVKSPFATVTIVAGTGVIAAPGISPATVPFGVPTAVTVTAAVTGTPDADSVMLQRLDSSGRVLAVLGSLHDDGLNGDVAANDGVYTLVTTFTEFAIGPISLRVSATFNGSASHVFSPVGTLTVTGAPPPTVTIASPTSLAYLSLSPTTVSGSVSDPTATVVINSISAPVDSSGKFSATIPLAEGPNILTATATSLSGSAGSASITVTLDTTPPHVTITSPMDKFVTTVSSLSVTGNVNDIVVGTVNSQQAQVTVNGVSSQVANRTFLALNVPLNMGSNTIQAVAVDRAGNSATTQITVVRQAPQPGQITLISGNNQAGTIGTALSAPLVVALTDSSRNPAANKSVIFAVTQDNGMLAAGNQSPAATVIATTDAQGHATANWTLGMRSGAGSDAVQAYSVGFSGTALFTATANQGPAGMIVMDSGNDQTGAVNQTLPKPFIAVVVDAGHNRLPNVPVTFTVVNGGGSFAGQPSVTVNTDSDGRAAATLALGFEEGNSNNLITADFTGDTSFPVTFTASGLGPGNPAQTVISGLVLDNSNQPIPGVTVRAVLTNVLNVSATSVQTAATVQTDANGNFAIYKAPVGYVKLMVDGSTATPPGTYPSLEFDMVTVPGQINTVGHPINLLPIKTDNQVCVTATTGGGTLTIPEAPRFSLTFGPGQVMFPGGSKSGCVSVTIVHPDKVPMVPGFGQQPRFIVTIQPSGALFDPPAPITLPNVDGLKPREVTEMYSFDHDINSFVAIGTGTVSDDGQVIRSNPGIGVLKAGWHCGGNPQTSGAAATCGPCAFCDGQNCQPNPVQGNTCQNPCLVGGQGICKNGYCSGTINVGTPCGNGGTCDQNGNCVFACVGPNCICTGPNCGGGCPNCNSGNPCIDDSCVNSQCVSTPNQLCQNACNGLNAGATCNVRNLTGICDSSGNCDLCPSVGTGASCTCGGGGIGTCSSGGQCQCGPTLQITRVQSTSDNSSNPPAGGVHSFLGCSLDTQFSPIISCSDTITINATVSGGQANNGINFNVTPIGPITDDPQQTNTGTPGAVTFSGVSTRVTAASNSLSACAPVPGSWMPGPTAVVCPSPALAYNVTADATVNGTPLSASLPPGQSIQQDVPDIIREEYIDFGNTVFLPDRTQIHAPPYVVFNWSYYQNPSLIAVDGPAGADIMSSILADLTNNFALLLSNLDRQVITPGTRNLSSSNAVVVQPRGALTIYDVTDSGKIPNSDNDVSWTGNTDPEGTDLCDKWLALDGSIINSISHNPPVSSPTSVCIGNILAPPNATAATYANYRQNPISAQFLFNVIHSAYRNPQKQVDLGSSINSYHTRGRALDFAAFDGFAPSQLPGKTSGEVRCLFQAAALNETSTWLNSNGQAGWRNIQGSIVELFSEHAAQTTGFTHCDDGASDHLHIAR